MAHEITVANGRLDIRLHGVLTDADLRTIAVEVLAIEAAHPAGIPRLTDLTELERVEVGFTEMLALAERRRATSPPPTRSALLVADDVQFGMARMFQTLNDHPAITLRIFRDRPEAVAWVDP